MHHRTAPPSPPERIARSAREPAAALLLAADRVEAAAPDVGNQTGAQR